MNEPEDNIHRDPSLSGEAKSEATAPPVQAPPAPLVPPAPVLPELDGSQRPDSNLQDATRWWLTLVLPPFLLLAIGLVLIVALGLAQRFGWITSASHSGQPQTAGAADKSTRYICPMMCTPPQSEPGRCPVCAM